MVVCDAAVGMRQAQALTVGDVPANRVAGGAPSVAEQ